MSGCQWYNLVTYICFFFKTDMNCSNYLFTNTMGCFSRWCIAFFEHMDARASNAQDAFDIENTFKHGRFERSRATVAVARIDMHHERDDSI